MRRPTSIISASLIAAACLSSTAARATPQTVFGAVSSYEVQGALMTIAGVPVGASAPTTMSGVISAGPLFDTCERALLVMVNRPGRFTLTVTVENGNVNACSLSQSP
jgi:hypothetical protein